jgi:hypothetical protein
MVANDRMKRFDKLRSDLTSELPRHPQAVAELLKRQELFPEVQEIFEPERAARFEKQRTGTRRAKYPNQAVAVIGQLHRAVRDLQRAFRRLEDPTLGYVYDKLASHLGSVKRGTKELAQFQKRVAELAAVVGAMSMSNKPGRPHEKAREWLERETVEVLFNAGVGLKGTRGAPSVVLRVITIMVEFAGYPVRPNQDMRTAGVKRALKRYAEIAREQKRGGLTEFCEYTPFEFEG